MSNKYFIKHPREQLFYKVIAYSMGLLALNSEYWPWFDLPKHVLYRYHRKCMLVLVPVAVFLQCIYILVHYTELQFETLSMIYTICPIACTVLLRCMSAQTKSYKTAMESFMTKIHLYNTYVIDQEEYVKKILIAAEKISQLSSFYYVGFCYVCTASFEAVPIIHNLQKIDSYSNITFRLEIIVHMWAPFDYEFNFTNWVIVQVIMVYIGLLAIAYITLFDIVNIVVIYHVIGHIMIFKHRIKTMFSDDNNMNQEKTKKNLIGISRYYTFMRQILNDVEAGYGLNVTSIYIHNLLGGGLFIYQLMTSGGDTHKILTYGLSIPINMGMLIMLSFALENIRILANDIPDLIYDIKWEDMSLSNQKVVLMLLIQVQSTLEFQAAFNIKTGVQPAITIIKTTFSYYVMIKSSV